MNEVHTMPAVQKPLEARDLGSIELSLTALMPIFAVLPLAPMQHAATFVLDSLVRRHAAMFARLRELGDTMFLIDVLDLPVLFALSPGAGRPAIKILRRHGTPTSAIATIGGALPDLLLLLQGRADGDALFFSRALTIQGDMAAVLCLRNALDGAEIDLIVDIADRFGPAAGFARRAMQFHSRMGLTAAWAMSRLKATPFRADGSPTDRATVNLSAASKS